MNASSTVRRSAWIAAALTLSLTAAAAPLAIAEPVPSPSTPSDAREQARKDGSPGVTVLLSQHKLLGTAVPHALIEHAELVDIASPMWFEADDHGRIAPLPNCDGPYDAYLGEVHRHGIQALPILRNFAPQPLLSDPQAVSRCATKAAAMVAAHGFDGLLIDFEHIAPDSREALVSFVKQLHTLLREQGRVLGVAVAAHSWNGEWDYANLGRHSDFLYVMFYDYTGPWKPIVGPTAPLRWPSNNRDIQRDLDNILTLGVPPRKILLGVPLYGNDFTLEAQGASTPASMEMLYLSQIKAIQARHDARRQWDKDSQTPYFAYRDEDGQPHQVWYEDVKSFDEKLDLIQRHGLGGVAIWCVRFIDRPSGDAFWTALKSILPALDRISK